MSGECGDSGMLEGGIIKDSTIISSTVTTTKIEASDFSGGSITALSAMDAVSAKTVLNALVALGPDQLAALGQLLLSSAAAVQTTTPPATDESSSLPTTVYGSRTAGMGAPIAWGNIGGYAVPLYTKGA